MTAPQPVYLDHAATTPVDPRVAAAMGECLADPALQANAASSHAPGRAVASRIAIARRQVARLVNAPPESIVFTSGATESVNLAILGAARAAAPDRRHVVTSRIEHRAGQDACRQLEREGFKVTWLKPDAEGRIQTDSAVAAVGPHTALVTLMHANNETGVLTDIEPIAAACRDRGVVFHVDAAQTVGRIPVDAAATGIALMSFCAHKLCGPKGIGALYVRRQPRPPLQALHFGGGHEGGLRSGTLATHQVIGFGTACELAAAALVAEPARIRKMRERLWLGLQSAAPLWRNGAPEPSVPGILNIGFAGIEGESLLLELEGRLALSSAAACSSARTEPSYVLRALGRSDAAIQASFRLSIGRGTSDEDVDRAARLIVGGVRRLRAALPAGALERIA